MKNRMLVLALCVLSALSPLKAQICSCPYSIINNLDCDVWVSYEVVDATCQQLCINTNVQINGNSSHVITTPCCVTGQDIYIIVTSPFTQVNSVNGVSNAGCNAGYLNPVENGNLPTGAGCDLSLLNTTYTITWGCSSTTINKP